MTVRLDHREELARRLAAAYISYVQGLSGVDYLLKQFREGSIGPFWIQLANAISDQMMVADDEWWTRIIDRLKTADEGQGPVQ